MRIIFLPSSDEDVRWFTRYYKIIFPEGSRRANARMKRTLSLLRDNPGLGRSTPEPGHHKLIIVGTPFPLTYRLAEDRIEILRVADGRANPPPDMPEGLS